MKKRLQWYELSLTALAVVMLSAVFIPHEIMCVVVVLGAASLLVVMASLARKQRLRITEWSDFARPILNNPADI